MMKKLDQLSENASALGGAGLDLARAEARALTGELKLSGRALARVLLLVGACLCVLFWAIAVLVFVGIEVAALWLPRWGAGLSVFAAMLLIVGVLALIAKHRWGRIDTPAATLRRRLDDYLDWWERRIVRRGSDGR